MYINCRMNTHPTSSAALVPAAPKGPQMLEMLDLLEARTEALFSRVPFLFRMLMRLFALLRDAAGRVPLGAVPDADVDAPVAVVRVMSERVAIAGRKCGARAARVAAVVACRVVRTAMPWCARDGERWPRYVVGKFKNFEKMALLEV